MKTVAIFFVAFFFVAVSALTEEQMQKLKQYRDDCTTETGIEPAKIDEAKNGVFDESNDKLGCYSACFLKKLGVMNADGTFNEQVAHEKSVLSMTSEQAHELINKCKGTSGTSHCDTGLKLFKCYKENSPVAPSA